MLMFYVSDTKRFMNFLFKDSFFSHYEARNVILQLFTRFEISCLYDKSFEEQSAPDDDESPRFCLWKELQQVIFSLIKGSKPPKLLKIVLCQSGDAAQKINENAAALFITIKYENRGVSVLTGTSQKQFSLDKSVDTEWDYYVRQLFSENGFEISEVEE